MCASFGAFNDNWRQAKYGKVINRYSCTYAPLGFWLSVAARIFLQSLLLANINLHAFTMYCMQRIFHFRDSSKSFFKSIFNLGQVVYIRFIFFFLLCQAISANLVLQFYSSLYLFLCSFFQN